MNLSRPAFFAAAAVLIAALATVAVLHHDGWRVVRAGPGAPVAASTAGTPRCTDMFVPDKPVNLGDARCLGQFGEPRAIGWHACTRARRLATVDATTGAPAGFAFDGQRYVAVEGELAADPRFAAAMDDCFDTPPPPR